MTAETIAGISDEHLAALVRGQWFDDDHAKSGPGWDRFVTVKNDDGQHRVRQWVYPCSTGPGWAAGFRRLTESHVGQTWFDCFEDALKWCDDRADNIMSAVKPSTRQTDRFSGWSTNR